MNAAARSVTISVVCSPQQLAEVQARVSRLMKKSRHIQPVVPCDSSDLLHLVVRPSFSTPC
jgi:hypothetical protein